MYNIEKMLAVRNKYLAQFSQTWNIYKGVLYSLHTAEVSLKMKVVLLKVILIL
jgi:hypothetical protein